jgi:hypothetical protein
VTGKAFYDIGHAPADHSNRRSTPKGYAVWEIHPVMKMEVIPWGDHQPASSSSCQPAMAWHWSSPAQSNSR